MYVKKSICRSFSGLWEQRGDEQEKQNAPAGCGALRTASTLRTEPGLLFAAVVLVAVDLARHTILLPVYLRFLLRS